jgi:hypothetical protein
MATTPDDIFEQLHDGLSRELLARIKDKTATASDLNVARQWLNDNHVAANPLKNPGLKALGSSMADLPFEAPTDKAH